MTVVNVNSMLQHSLLYKTSKIMNYKENLQACAQIFLNGCAISCTIQIMIAT